MRGLRTAVQVLLAAAAGLTGLVAAHVLTATQATAAGAVLTFLAGLIAVGMNAWEEHSGTRIIGSTPPPFTVRLEQYLPADPMPPLDAPAPPPPQRLRPLRARKEP